MAGYPPFNPAVDTAGSPNYKIRHIPKLRRDAQGYQHKVMERTASGSWRAKKRTIMAPCPVLKATQRKLAEDLGRRGLGATPFAHAYVRRRSIKTNAKPHVGAWAICKLDLQDYFPSITWPMVKAELLFFFRRGNPHGLISRADQKLLDRVERFCFLDGGLPQGSAVSPLLSNVVGAKIDFYMARLLRTWHRRPVIRNGNLTVERKQLRVAPIAYTRYSDDLCFSSCYSHLWELQFAVEYVLTQVGFTVHPEKTVFKQRPARLTICGVVVNDMLSTPRPRRRGLRNRLHRLIYDQHLDRCPSGRELRDGQKVPLSFEALSGLVSFINFINPAQGVAFQSQLRVAVDVHNATTPQSYSPESRAYLKL